MRATGIVRRIDDLGRVVIPKEIRRTLRIREGDPLEIYTDSGGEVIFKKYSPMGEMSSFAEQYAEVINRVAKRPVIITDRDHVIAASGVSRKEYIDRRISSTLEDLIEKRQSYTADRGTLGSFTPIEGIDKCAAAALPIISSGDITGSIVLLVGDNAALPSESDVKLLQAAAAFLAKQNES